MLKNNKKGFEPKNENDLGFGTKIYGKYNRFLNKDGTVNIKRKGQRLTDSIDLYHALITMRWSKFLLLVMISYGLINLLFALIYFSLPDNSFGNLSSLTPLQNFFDLFFFSAQTLTTVGYGYIYPISIAASTLAAIESMVGLMGFALATGILYGRFSRPTSGIIYSDNIIVAPYKGITGLMFRIANSKQNELIEIEAQVVLSMKNIENNSRVFLPLTLERVKINFLALNWTIVHPIEEDSPLINFSKDDFFKADAEFIILIKAINDTYSQDVYSRNSYKYDELIYGAKFKPMISETNNSGMAQIKINQISAFELSPINKGKSIEVK